jgi:histidinol-phosphate aminotransferase
VESRVALHAEISALAKKYVKLEKVYDSVTNFVFIKTAYGKEIYEKLLEKSIAIRYMGNYIRITAGTKEENEAVVKALDEILDNMTKGE